jgi:hypothetical protein
MGLSRTDYGVSHYKILSFFFFNTLLPQQKSEYNQALVLFSKYLVGKKIHESCRKKFVHKFMFQNENEPKKNNNNLQNISHCKRKKNCTA